MDPTVARDEPCAQSNSTEPLVNAPQAFDFLSLPPELRNRIYELAVTCQGQVKMWMPNDIWGPIRPKAAGLILANRQTYNESIKLYYSHNIFVLSIFMANPLLPPSIRKNLKHIRFFELAHTYVPFDFDLRRGLQQYELGFTDYGPKLPGWDGLQMIYFHFAQEYLSEKVGERCEVTKITPKLLEGLLGAVDGRY